MTISDSSKVLVIRTVLFVTYVLIGGAIFREIEREEQLREMDRLYDIRMEILRKYNISPSDAKKWSDTFLSASLGNEGFLEWSYGNSVLFAMVVVTTIGKILQVTGFFKSGHCKLQNINKFFKTFAVIFIVVNVY